ncbi:NTP transferase domain-containing protein [Streptomyces sp. Li-HN-5-11]|uniref:nucleotidyltransferase family protein n=1 Tax=Streptomyces sp. Li-HN-5-11 TaxID=3075432 RepID=UPI0028AFEDA1|nr:NTP transferase domain-containing protein [Streptomyces sp. Li-HN-5-11]WNM35374.1 NTP transferase domain-containing protein [Streptomyces sp. Li-HN-5-11]
MSKVRSAGIMAGGSGSRLVTDGIHTPKPFLLVADRPLISFFLDDARTAGIEHIVVAIRPDDDVLPEFLSRDERFSWEFVETMGTGTLEAVLALTDRLGAEDHIISTCDVVLPPGSTMRLIEAAERFRDQEPAIVLLGTDLVHDTTPIWLHRDPARPHILTRLGKGEEPSPFVFGNVRWVRKNLGDLVSECAEGLQRDTHFLNRLTTSHPGSIFFHFQPEVIDIDDRRDLDFAQRLVAASSLYRVNGRETGPMEP